MQQKVKSFKVTTPEFRTSFAHVFKPHTAFQGQDPVYSLEALFPKTDKLLWLKGPMREAAIAMWGSDESKWPKNMKNPIKDGDQKELEGYPGNWFLTLKSKTKPGIIDRNQNEILDQNDFYSGCYARATIVVKAYSVSGSNGIGVYLQNIQKVRDGESFAGKRNAKDDFDALEELADSSDSNPINDMGF